MNNVYFIKYKFNKINKNYLEKKVRENLMLLNYFEKYLINI